MLKQNDWYYVPKHGLSEVMGILVKVIKTTDNPNYVDIEQWKVMKDRKYEAMGIYKDADSVELTKNGRKVKPPSKVFEILYSESVREKLAVDQTLDTENEYLDDEWA
jgi:hypothetical protein